MDVTEQARRSDALYYSGNDGINRRWLCDKVASLEAALELCDSDARDHLRDFTAENAKLQAKCAKLLELLVELYEDQCDKGDRWRYRDRMRELGAEVE